MSQKHPERKVAEASPRKDEDIVAYALRMLEFNRQEARKRGLPVIAQKSFVRKCTRLRKELERSLGTLRKGSDPPFDPLAPAFVEHMRLIEQKRKEDFEKGPLRFVASLFATAERARRDPKYLESFPRERRVDQTREEYWKDRDARMVKPWKGSAGREVVKEVGTTTEQKHRRRLQTIEWHRKGITDAEIARKLGCSVKTVQRDLKGQR